MKSVMFLCIFALIFSCQTKLILPAEDEAFARTPRLQNGQKVFMEACNRCHPAGNAGLGPSFINKPLPAFLIRMQVRNGLGVMPSFDRDHMSNDELDSLIAYIKALRKEAK